MSQFSNNTWFKVEDCCACGVQFAMTDDFQRRRLKDKKTFYCPSGHGQSYVGETEEQNLKAQLARKQRELDDQALANSNLRVQRDSLKRSYTRMRDRVKNGVCPCCNRTFGNLADHMKTQHPEFGTHDVLKTMRTLFGMSQTALAEEIGVHASYVSMYERQKPELPGYAKDEIEAWIAAASQ